ncbi:hypothetical protein NADFUDRAFT_83231, partial [Nadsonia fulvescens var. elongata DSM 6958]
MPLTNIPIESPPEYDAITSEVHRVEQSVVQNQSIERSSSPVSSPRFSIDSNEDLDLHEAPGGRLVQSDSNQGGSLLLGSSINAPYDTGNNSENDDEGVDDVIQEMEQMEILEPEDFSNDNSFSTRAALASHRLAKKMN